MTIIDHPKEETRLRMVFLGSSGPSTASVQYVKQREQILSIAAHAHPWL